MATSLLTGRRFAFVSHLDFNLCRFRLPIMQALQQQGAEVWAITPPGSRTRCFANHDIRYLPWEIKRRSLSPLEALAAVNALRRLLHRIQPDLVHSFTQRPNLYMGLARQWGTPGRWIASVTGLGNLYLEEGWRWRSLRLAIEALLRWGFTSAQALIFQNRDDLQYYLQRRLCTKMQARLIRGSGIDVQAFAPGRVTEAERHQLRQTWGLPEDAFVVLMIARLIRTKGVEEFLQVAQSLATTTNRIYFVLIGDPDPGNPSSFTAAEMARWRQVPRLILPGFQERVQPWLSLADLYVLPSYREGLPRTVLEAMAMGLPIVTTNVPGCRETVEPGVNGFLIPPRDVEALRTKILWFFRHPAQRRQMGEASRRKAVEEFALERVVAQHLTLYRQVLRP